MVVVIEKLFKGEKIMKKNGKTGNEGFSLVELIIVISIMAILMGVVGTQVVPYLEKSRQTKDRTLLDTYATTAVSTFAFEADNITGATDDIVLTVSTSGLAEVTSAPGVLSEDAIVAQFNTLTGGKKFAFKSKAARGKSITITFSTTGAVTATATGSSPELSVTTE